MPYNITKSIPDHPSKLSVRPGHDHIRKSSRFRPSPFRTKVADKMGISHGQSAHALPASQHQHAFNRSEHNRNLSRNLSPPMAVTYGLTELDLEDLPPGFLYTGWRGMWSFAWEYVRSMRGLLTEWTGETGRYGPVRHTT